MFIENQFRSGDIEDWSKRKFSFAVTEVNDILKCNKTEIK